MFRNAIDCSDCKKSETNSRYPGEKFLDRLADEKISAKYNVRRSNQCVVCFVAKSANGSCLCSN